MVALGGTYTADPDNVQGDYSPIPPGEYRVHVISSDLKATKAGTGNYLELEMEVLDGEHQGRKLFDRLNIDNPNQQAVDIAQRTLNAICVAVGKLSIADSNELHNIPMIAVVKVDPARGDYGPSNSIKTYKPAGGGNVTAAAAQNSAPANSNSSPPWKRAG
ncbi:MAG: hypothetical protein CMK96_03385 [Pseudomonas sp.]|jgi:hypothetical protein|nr:hypothetical protein [Pseudomonas sp.]|tara:strand:- start:1036 stop:1518 length:483 start_codon:yes stop_codon:yes gene_type:complete